MKLAKFSAKLAANFRRSLAGDFRASFVGENRQRHFPPKLHRKFHHQTSLRGSGLWRALKLVKVTYHVDSWSSPFELLRPGAKIRRANAQPFSCDEFQAISGNLLGNLLGPF